MSAAVRELIANAASSVEGINCTPYFRQTSKAGQAVVRLDHVEYPNVFGGVTTWQVLVILPQDLATAEKSLERWLPELTGALAEHMVIKRAEPQQLITENQTTVPCLVIEGIREMEA